MTVNLILASASPRRRELLAQLGLSFSIKPSNADETLLETAPEAAVKELALRKARSVADQVDRALIIGADTLVVCEGEMLGKPQDEADAMSMLMRLQGRAHQVISGIALVEVSNGEIIRSEVEARKTDVWMLPLSEEQIEWYIQTGEPLDKAGAYGIQGIGASFIDKIEGCYFNVVGLSLSLLTQMLGSMGYHINDFVTGKCSST